MNDERGAALVEFAFALSIYIAFLFGLLSISLWGIGALFMQEAAHNAAGSYAVTLNEQIAVERSLNRLESWAYVFVDKGSIEIDVRKKGDKAIANVTAEPLIKNLYCYKMPVIEKESSCTLEYRFRDGG